MPQHFRCSIVQSKAWSSQAAIGWLHSRKAKIDQSDLSLVSLTFIQQVLQGTKSIVNTAHIVVVNAFVIVIITISIIIIFLKFLFKIMPWVVKIPEG